jgi:hypothetical protein
MNNMHSNMFVHIVQSVVAAGAIIAAEIPYNVSDWVNMVERLGLAIALVVFFVATGWQREKRMAKRLDWLERENDKLSTRTAVLAEQVHTSLIQTTSTVTETLKILDGRMCWACQNREEFEELQKIIKEKKQQIT